MPITVEENLQLLKDVCGLLNKNNLDYLVYGSSGYRLITGDQDVPIRDLDIVVKQSDFPQLTKSLPSLSFNPIQTPFTIHANSLTLHGEDGKPFDVSLDSYEHYFFCHNVDLKNFIEIDLQSVLIRVMTAQDLIKIYEIGSRGSNQDKVQEYKEKINNLKKLGY